MMRRRKANPFLLLSLAALSFCGFLIAVSSASGGEPIAVGGQVGTPGEFFVWDTQTSIPYRTDGGPLGKFDNSQANNVVEEMFGVWEAVPTATIEFISNGQLKSVGAFTDGDVSDMAEFNAVTGNCDDERIDTNSQSPIIYDADGTLFEDLALSSNVIGFAGPCGVDNLNQIRGGNAALNGKFIDEMGPPELTEEQFRQAFTHEFGHFAGLGHSQINIEVLSQLSCDSDDVVGLPLMFPKLQCEARVTLGLNPLAPDDIAWISLLYPRQPDFDNQFGRITGQILSSDGVTPVQGANVIAREEDDAGTVEREDRRNAVSVVSGYKFTGNPGQTVTGTNTDGSPFGSRDPALIGFYEIPIRAGDYTVEVESIDPQFTEGSSIGPLGSAAGEQFPLPGPPEFWDLAETDGDDPATSDLVTVTANVETTDINIILNGTPSRFDTFESARLWLREPAPAWVRRELLLDSRMVG